MMGVNPAVVHCNKRAYITRVRAKSSSMRRIASRKASFSSFPSHTKFPRERIGSDGYVGLV
jgi:hypothetical protein